ncbi:MAG: class I mannose-6-phosphate isomerase [Clostridiales bacterium]|nr:class I mannose-6-phosphate isomerase [Clostridiales bacterium]
MKTNETIGHFPIRLDNPRAWRTYLGGSQLDLLHGKPDGEDGHFPEEWIMSVVAARNAGREDIRDEGMSHIYGTEMTLKELLEKDPAAYLGADHAAKSGASLGVLVKLIDSAERLTLQVHPDRETAMKLFHSPYGKTECWHILGGHEVDGEKPCIYFGFREGITREYWKRLFDEQDIPGMLSAMQKFEVYPGDTILIESGMPHAIGAGCFLAEIQEPTDFTIRVERTTPSGFAVADFMCHQGLGFERMFDAFHYVSMSREEIRDKYFVRPKTIQQESSGSVATLIGYDTTPLFRLDEIRAASELTVANRQSFGGLYVLEGEGTLCANGRETALEKTAQYFIPAGTGDFQIRAASGRPLRILHFYGPEE